MGHGACCSQASLQFGVGHLAGGPHSHVHCGVSHTLRQGCCMGHIRWQTGSPQTVEHAPGQSIEGQPILGQTTVHVGFTQSILHCEMSGAEHRVSHFGGLHLGVQTSSQAGLSHCQRHWGAQLLGGGGVVIGGAYSIRTSGWAGGGGCHCRGTCGGSGGGGVT